RRWLQALFAEPAADTASTQMLAGWFATGSAGVVFLPATPTPPTRTAKWELKKVREVLEVVEDGGGCIASGQPSPTSPNLPTLHNLLCLWIHNSTSCGRARQW